MNALRTHRMGRVPRAKRYLTNVEVEIAEGTRPLVALRLICPTKNCPSVPGRLGLSG